MALMGQYKGGKSTLANILVGSYGPGNFGIQANTRSFTRFGYYDPTTKPSYETRYIYGSRQKYVISVHDFPGASEKYNYINTEYLVQNLLWVDFVIFVIPASDLDLNETKATFNYLRTYSKRNFLTEENIVVIVTFWKETEQEEHRRNSKNMTKGKMVKDIRMKFCRELGFCLKKTVYFIDTFFDRNDDAQMQHYIDQLDAFANYIEENNPAPMCFDENCPFRNLSSVDSLWLRNLVNMEMYQYYDPYSVPGPVWSFGSQGTPLSIPRNDNDKYLLESKLHVRYLTWKCKVQFCWGPNLYFIIGAGFIGVSLIFVLVACCFCRNRKSFNPGQPIKKKSKKCKCKKKCKCAKKSMEYKLKEKKAIDFEVPEGMVLTDSGCSSESEAVE